MTLCTGCSVCVEQCPCHAMEMVAELKPVVVSAMAAASVAEMSA